MQAEFKMNRKSKVNFQNEMGKLLIRKLADGPRRLVASAIYPASGVRYEARGMKGKTASKHKYVTKSSQNPCSICFRSDSCSSTVLIWKTLVPTLIP